MKNLQHHRLIGKNAGPESSALFHPGGVIYVIRVTTVFSVQVSGLRSEELWLGKQLSATGFKPLYWSRCGKDQVFKFQILTDNLKDAVFPFQPLFDASPNLAAVRNAAKMSTIYNN